MPRVRVERGGGVSGGRGGGVSGGRGGAQFSSTSGFKVLGGGGDALAAAVRETQSVRWLWKNPQGKELREEERKRRETDRGGKRRRRRRRRSSVAAR